MIASARAGNVIGGGDWCKDRIFTDIMKSLKSKEPIQVRNPLAVRPWQHVLEPLSGYLLLGSKAFSANCENYASGWNFGPDNNDLITVKEVVETAIDSWGNGSWNDASTPNALHEANLLQLDITKAKKELEWRPLLSVNESIQYTVDWYKKTEATKSLKYSMSQLQTYVEKAKESNAIWTQK